MLNNLVFSDRAVTVVKCGEELMEECSQPKDEINHYHKKKNRRRKRDIHDDDDDEAKQK